MSDQPRHPGGTPAAGRFAPGTRGEPGLRLVADRPERDLPETARVAVAQACLARATARPNAISPIGFQDAARQVNAEAYALLATPNHHPLPDAGQLGRAQQLTRQAAPADLAPVRPGALPAERVEEIATYFTARARTAAAADPDALEAGPTTANAIINESLRTVARLRHPDAGSSRIEGLFQGLRYDLIDDLEEHR